MSTNADGPNVGAPDRPTTNVVVLDRQTILDTLAATCDFTTTERERWADALIAAGTEVR